jgi:hypothetical protein
MNRTAIAIALAVLSLSATAEKLVEVASNAKTATRYMIDQDSVASGKTSYSAILHSYSTKGVHEVSNIGVRKTHCGGHAGTLFMWNDDTKDGEALQFGWSIDNLVTDSATVSDSIGVSLCLMGNGTYDDTVKQINNVKPKTKI